MYLKSTWDFRFFRRRFPSLINYRTLCSVVPLFFTTTPPLFTIWPCVIQLYNTARIPRVRPWLPFSVSPCKSSEVNRRSHEFSWWIGLCVRQIKGERGSFRQTDRCNYLFISRTENTLPGRLGIPITSIRTHAVSVRCRYFDEYIVVAAEAVHESSLFRLYTVHGVQCSCSWPQLTSPGDLLGTLSFPSKLFRFHGRG